jgi:hypothetical protein
MNLAMLMCVYRMYIRYVCICVRACMCIYYCSVVNYLGRTLTHQNFMYGEIMSKLNSGNACYHSGHNTGQHCKCFRREEVADLYHFWGAVDEYEN